MSSPADTPPVDLGGEHAPHTEEQRRATRAEVTSWFFEDYLPRWVAVASGASDEGPEFIHEYWGTPMHVTGLGHSFWCLEDADVLAFLDLNFAPLRAAGYTHTVVPDQRVFVYSAVGAAIEVIWSRRAADESELQRWATHFEVARSDHGWRVVGLHGVATAAETLDSVWPHGASEEGAARG